jgi:hypothetical protein
MSSAILYLAIIAIWAGVLIPRWLRRDSARSHPAHDVGNQPAGEADTTDDFGSAPVFADGPEGSAGYVTATIPDYVRATIPDAGAPSGDAGAVEADDDAGIPEADDPKAGSPAPASPAQSRQRVLAARRRLLWMMLALEAAADVLASSGLAAWWVIAPPTVMLAGYLLLLREAAHADAERDARERDAAQARQEARHAWEAGKAGAAQHPSASPVAPAVFAAAPVPEDYEALGSGRDFTPGGRYTSSGDVSTEEDDDTYDQYTEERLRAVGD